MCATYRADLGQTRDRMRRTGNPGGLAPRTADWIPGSREGRRAPRNDEVESNVGFPRPPAAKPLRHAACRARSLRPAAPNRLRIARERTKFCKSFHDADSMASRDNHQVEITPEVLLKAYACGIFPMAENADDPALYWIEPELRGIIPLETFHVPSRLARTVRAEPYAVVCNRDFEAVLDGCSEPGPGRSRTWINGRIRNLYRKLYDIGHCHTVEVYDGADLVGGLYGVSLGRTFFGESMFHRARDASKVALVHLVANLKPGGFLPPPPQSATPHPHTLRPTPTPPPPHH